MTPIRTTLVFVCFLVFSSFCSAVNYTDIPADSMDVKKYQWGIHAINAPPAWDITPGGASVGIMDSILSDYMEDLPIFKNYRKLRSTDTRYFIRPTTPGNSTTFDFLDHENIGLASHGMHVASVAIGNDENTYKGVCPDCSFVASTIRNFDPDGNKAGYDLIRGGVSVINISSSSTYVLDPSDVDITNPNSQLNTLHPFVTEAKKREIVIVAASGNSEVRQEDFVKIAGYPASYPGVIPVGAAAKQDRLSPENWGPHTGVDWRRMKSTEREGKEESECSSSTIITKRFGSRRPVGINHIGVIAPGVDIIGVFPTGVENYRPDSSGCVWATASTGHADNYAILTGTSLAAPHVAGIAGLIRTLDPLQSASQTAEIINQSASNYKATKKEVFNSPSSVIVNFDWGLKTIAGNNYCVKLKFDMNGQPSELFRYIENIGVAANFTCDGRRADENGRPEPITLTNDFGGPYYLNCGIDLNTEIKITPEKTADGISYCRPWVGGAEASESEKEKVNHAGHGMVNAERALHLTLAANPSRLTPLFSLYSEGRKDTLHTIYPQISIAAIKGELYRFHSSIDVDSNSYTPIGKKIARYYRFPSISGQFALAEMWVFTTNHNPYSPVALTPLKRFVQNDLPLAHTVLSANDQEELSLAEDGYVFDGLEGYVYPATEMQPAGTEKIFRGYSLNLDDTIIFPESLLNEKLSLGYDVDVTNILGYAYANNGVSKPSYPTSQYLENHPVPLTPSSGIEFEVSKNTDGSNSYNIGFTWTKIANATSYRVRIYQSAKNGNPFASPSYVDTYPTSCNSNGRCAISARLNRAPRPDMIWGVSPIINGQMQPPHFLNKLRIVLKD